VRRFLSPAEEGGSVVVPPLLHSTRAGRVAVSLELRVRGALGLMSRFGAGDRMAAERVSGKSVIGDGLLTRGNSV
jgi:hypothetical protein